MPIQKRCPIGINSIMTMVEGGYGTDEIATALQEISDLKALQATEGDKVERFPDEIRIIAQALAFRSTRADTDFEEVLGILTSAYSAEVIGLESFRDGESINKEDFADLFRDDSYQWIMVECPNGQGVEPDGTIIGVCCFSTNGISRRNGEVEGNLGVVRYYGVLPRYHGLCIGRRLLERVESAMERMGCVRCMVCIPDPRFLMISWVERRGYKRVGDCTYPTLAGHTLRSENIKLIQLVKAIKSSIEIEKKLNNSRGGRREEVKESEEEWENKEVKRSKEEEKIDEGRMNEENRARERESSHKINSKQEQTIEILEDRPQIASDDHHDVLDVD